MMTSGRYSLAGGEKAQKTALSKCKVTKYDTKTVIASEREREEGEEGIEGREKKREGENKSERERRVEEVGMGEREKES